MSKAKPKRANKNLAIVAKMPANHVQFVQAITKGYPPEDAYMIAFPKAKSMENVIRGANRLMRDPDVLDLLSEIRKSTLKASNMDKDEQLAMLCRIARRNEIDDPRISVMALKLIADSYTEELDLSDDKIALTINLNQ